MAMNRRALFLLLAVAALVILFLFPQRSMGVSGFEMSAGPVGSNTAGLNISDAAPVSGMKGPTFDVTGAGLIPREVNATEDFGQFSPANILSGQNYLDPRSQIGYPETVGGVLRNANRQERSEPINPRDPVSIWNLSTIPPDTMRPRFEITPEWQ
jgi:hypothetical protein